MATPDFRLRDDGETAGTPPSPSSDDDLDLAAPDSLASFDVADATGAAGPGDLYDPEEDPNATTNRLDDLAGGERDEADPALALLDPLQRAAEAELQAAAGQAVAQGDAHVLVEAAQDIVAAVDHRDLAAEPAE